MMQEESFFFMWYTPPSFSPSGESLCWYLNHPGDFFKAHLTLGVGRKRIFMSSWRDGEEMPVNPKAQLLDKCCLSEKISLK